MRAQQNIEERPIKSQYIWVAILQTVGVIAAIVFGVFAVLAYVVARDANTLATNAIELSSTSNDLSDIANRLALLAYCDQSPLASDHG